MNLSAYTRRLYRLAFALAGVYNLGFGLWAALRPRHFFALAGMDPPRYPEIWACLGMVVGIYGFLYWYAAWKLERGRPIIAVGLLGKVLGPIGMAMAIGGGNWPPRAAMLCIYNDLIWWLPFGLFLATGTRVGELARRAAPWLCVVLHLGGCVALATIIEAGSELEADVPARMRFVAEHAAAWRIGWSVWMLSAASVVGFYAWWGARLPCSHWTVAAPLIAGAGMVFDATGECLYAVPLVEHASVWSTLGIESEYHLKTFVSLQRCGTWLTAGAANGLYTIAGLLLMLATPALPAAIRAAMWLTWIAGFGMSLAALLDSVAGMVVATSVLFPLFIFWVAWLGWRWR